MQADLNHFRAILRNLIGNALKFTKESGEIRISAIEVEGLVIVSVADTGVGMSEEQMAKLFGKTFHFSTRGTHNENDTGLGLLLCKEFVEKEEEKFG